MRRELWLNVPVAIFFSYEGIENDCITNLFHCDWMRASISVVNFNVHCFAIACHSK